MKDIEILIGTMTDLQELLARLMPREIHADVNAGYSLIELLQEIDEREAKAKE